MVFSNPGSHTTAKRLGEFPDFLRFCVCDGMCPFVIGDVTLLAKHVEFPDGRCRQAQREFQGVDYPVMMISALGLVPLRRESRRGELNAAL